MSDSGFDKQSRLLSALDFSNLKLDSLVFKKPSLIIYYKKNSLGIARLGLSVSKKVGNSPTRNRFKRLLRENFRQSSIRNIDFDILIVVSFTRSMVNATQEEKEAILLTDTNLFFNKISEKK